MDSQERQSITEANQNDLPKSVQIIAINQVTERIIGCAIEVHRILGPGLLEPIYESALGIEFEDAGLKYERQIRLPVYYKERLLGEQRVDLIVNDLVLVEIKAVDRLHPVFEAQLLTYLRLTRKR